MLKAVPTAPLMAPTLAVSEPLAPLQVDALPGGAGLAERVDGDIERAALVDVDCLAAARQVDVGDGQGTYRAAAGAAVVDAGLAALRGGDVEAFDGIASRDRRRGCPRQSPEMVGFWAAEPVSIVTPRRRRSALPSGSGPGR